MVPPALNNPTQEAQVVDHSHHKVAALNLHQMLSAFPHNSITLVLAANQDSPHPAQVAPATATPKTNARPDHLEPRVKPDTMVWMDFLAFPEKMVLTQKMPQLKPNNTPVASTAQPDPKGHPDHPADLVPVVCVELVVNPEYPVAMVTQDSLELSDLRDPKGHLEKKANPVTMVKMQSTQLDFPDLKENPDRLDPKEMKDHVEIPDHEDPKDQLVTADLMERMVKMEIMVKPEKPVRKENQVPTPNTVLALAEAVIMEVFTEALVATNMVARLVAANKATVAASRILIR